MSTLLEQLKDILGENPSLKDEIDFDFLYSSSEGFCVTLDLRWGELNYHSEDGLDLKWNREWSLPEVSLIKWFLHLTGTLEVEGFHFDLLEDIRLEFV